MVFIQLMGVVLGLVSTYLIAGDMDPEVYSLAGVYNIIAGITSTFTDLGVETTMMREALYWIENKEQEKIKEYTTQALISRVIGIIFLFPFIFGYIVFLGLVKYKNNNWGILIIFILGAEIGAMNNALSLIVRAKGGFVFSQALSMINNYAVKFLGIIIYFWRGAETYLHFYALSSIPLFIVYLLKLKRSFSSEFVDIKRTWKKIVDGRYLWLKTDLDYFKGNADSILVSVLFTPSILGSYSIFKMLENIAKNFVEGFFDVLTQSCVRYKGNEKKLKFYEKKIKIARNLIVLFLCVGTFIYCLNMSFWVDKINLSKYFGMERMILCVSVCAVIYVLGKYEINILALFASSKLNFGMGIATFVVTIVSFIVIIVNAGLNSVLAQRIFIYLFSSILAILLFKKTKAEIYFEIKK